MTDTTEGSTTRRAEASTPRRSPQPASAGVASSGVDSSGVDSSGVDSSGVDRPKSSAGYELVDFAQLPGTPCPCGTARRAFADVEDFPGTIHVTEISSDAKRHYHKKLTETYYFLECGVDAQMELNGQLLDVHPGMCILIRPGTRHRAVGRMKVLIVVYPKFDPDDEWFD